MMKAREKPVSEPRPTDRQLDGILAELRRHERIKRAHGELDIHDRALHHRARNIAKN